MLLTTFALAAVLCGIEYWRGVRGTDWANNLAAWAMYLLVAVAMLPLVPFWQGRGLLDAHSLPFWLAFPLFFLVADLGEYLYHRAQHRIPFLWAMHSLHHSDPEMSATTTARHFWGDQIIKQVTIWSASSMIISPTTEIASAYAVLGLWNFVVHSAVPLDLGRWSWLINTPVYHRRHHSCLPEHYDSNFAAILPIFDVLAGTYRRGQGLPPTGLDRQPRNFAEVALWPLVFSGLLKAPKPAASPGA